MRHPRARVWETVAATVVGGAALAGLRTVRGKPLRSTATTAAGGAGLAAGLLIYEWLPPRSWLYDPVFWHARTMEPVVALTFDDGPCHPYTEQLLNILDREGIQATFFMVGNGRRSSPRPAGMRRCSPSYDLLPRRRANRPRAAPAAAPSFAVGCVSSQL